MLCRCINANQHYADKFALCQTIEASKGNELAESRRIIKQLRCRKLYEFIDEYLLPPELTSRIPKVTSEDIACYNVSDGVRLDPDDIMISDGRLNYNLDDQNPVDNVRFYSSNDLDSSFFIPKDQVSLLFPEKVRGYIENCFLLLWGYGICWPFF